MPLCTVTDTCCSGQPLVTLTSNTGAFAATIAPAFGGACVSLRHGGHELLAGACVFSEGAMKGRIPVLFPAVGRSFHGGELGRYQHRGQVYPMDIHGFAKDAVWTEVDRGADALSAWARLRLEAEDSTLASYPYPFALELEYRVAGATLSLTAELENCGTTVMPFCFGYHPYFRAPLDAGTRADCVVRVPGSRVWEMSEGQPTGRQLDPPSELAAGKPLPDEHLELITACLEPDPQTGRLSTEVCDTVAGKTLRVWFNPTQLDTVTVFSPADAGYVCLEPRCGLPNALSDDAPVTEGVQRLAPGQQFATRVDIEVLTAL